MRFLRTNQIVNSVCDIIRSAEKQLYLVSYSIQLGEDVMNALEDCNVRPVLIYGTRDELKDDEYDKLDYLGNVDLYHIDNLHAKCYMNEKKAIVTSMNLYEKLYEDRNIEMGIEIGKDEPIFDEIRNYVENLQQIAEPEDFSFESDEFIPRFASPHPNHGTHFERHFSGRQSFRTGMCIRCGCEIPFNPERPLCPDCYDVWAEFGNPDYPEQFCHKCGKPSHGEIDFDHPLCRQCYYESRRY